jgi:UDP-glucose 4-epimerase
LSTRFLSADKKDVYFRLFFPYFFHQLTAMTQTESTKESHSQAHSDAKPRALILGGAGFIGSAIAEYFSSRAWDVVVIDGLCERTSGRAENIASLSGVRFVREKVEDVANLDEYLSASDIIIDAMAWTAHRLALYEPFYDAQLNQFSHLRVATALERHKEKRVIYLSSRGVYGNYAGAEITEETPLLPDDVQGVHKLAAESYYRIYAKLYGYSVVSLRFGNCFGKNMPVEGDDIGLIGGFIRDALEGRTIEVFGTHRTRPVVYAGDVAEYVWRVAMNPNDVFQQAFTAFNLNGQMIPIHELARLVVEACGMGEVVVKPLPHEIQTIDIGSTPFSAESLRALTDFTPSNDWSGALAETVAYYRERLQRV